MNRYPLWKYITVLVAVIIGLLYTLPNFYGESPAVQVSSAKATIKVDPAMLSRVEQILTDAKIPNEGVYYEQNGTLGTVRARFTSTDLQLQARDLIDKSLNTVAGDPHYTVALNLLPASPAWMRALGWFAPKPMYLGLDLRGGVHFLLQVDMQGALTARYDSLAADVRSVLRDQKVNVAGVERSGMAIAATFANTDDRDRAISTLRSRLPDLEFTERMENGKPLLMAALNPAAVTRVQDSALKQNINTLHNRINELGVAEPVIQQTASWCSCPACRTWPRPRNCWAAPPRWKSAWSTTPPPRRPRCWAAACPSALNATTTATAVPSWSAARSS
jgi:preprotein translocase subunit SecD